MGKNWAIVVGINNYDNLQSLKYAKRDAEVMAAWLGKEAHFQEVFLFTEDSPPIKATPPIPTKPTFGCLRRFLNAQFERPLLKPEDNFWFFFADHGRRYADQDYLMLSDSDPEGVEHTAISVDYVTRRLRRSGADNVVLFLDACRDQGSRGGLGIGIDDHQGVITFYSCSANQKSWEIDELQHGSFTHTLLTGLRQQGEANCATVERLNLYLQHEIPQVNAYYKKPKQNPYLKAEPPHKMYYILLEQFATLRDVERLKLEASLAENKGDWSLAEQLWVRVLAVSHGDSHALDAIKRIARRQQPSTEPIISTSKPVTTLGGERSVSSESTQELEIAQQAEAHQQNLVRYQQAFLEAIEREFPVSQATRRELKQLQQSFQISNDEREQIEQPILAKKDAENRKRQQEEAERLRRQQEAERLKQQEEDRRRQQQEAERLQLQQEAEQLKQQEADRRRQQQEALTTRSTTRAVITRQKFLKWAGLGGAGLVTAVVGREIFISISPEPSPPSSPKPISLQSFNFQVVTVNSRGEITSKRSSQAKFFTEDLGNDIILHMVEIPAGSFKMGSPPQEKNRQQQEGPVHTVNVPAFFLGKFEVTQEQYQQVMSSNPSNFKGAKRSVEGVSWNKAVEFCNKLSRKTGRKYRLPSEAEWEYAARAGTTTPFHFGETITTELANYNGKNHTYASEPKGEYRQQTTKVGSFPPNGFGLYDMHGQVWEWCQDNWHQSYEGAPSDGSAWIDDNNQIRLLRGGSWLNSPGYCRSAYRLNLVNPVFDLNRIGFRVACAVA